MELLCYLAPMFNTQHYPSNVLDRIAKRLCDVFGEYFDDTYYAESLVPQDGSASHMCLVVNREDGIPFTARDFMDFHHFLTAVCYHDPILKDLIMFDDFYFYKDKPLQIVSLGFDIL